ncbi:intercellular adhesin biosynthesis polysaccharide N-deacetylase [Alkalibacterium putridalgicola]|uniref:Intercellular adhesin biosynthesis polysaccharide N-deacetylase n=1 Tax=Alkalibacterium putridalgicola TaxID=426703 RepID=A0A1H7QQR5_9LACT|nr:polysaccharide deacetylase family protein [Alkalibacterium putridalgicola]GEK88370.1 poly-beta-1,6-N-acetyl-D-glucosamine N-deacetylase [Alkalibacterium putridalgicola]SEL50341.1 intercellular adhesin biosynthesis polysaccharide N-deacetylase [Alkalibacterium putridalgicola]
MNKRNRLTYLTGILLVLLAAWFVLSKGQNEKTAVMTFPEPLETNGCLALNYHRVRDGRLSTTVIETLTQSDELQYYSVYTDEFDRQMRTLKEEGAYFATLEEIMAFQAEGAFPDKCVWVSFDDIDITVYENAFPILERYDIPFTLYAIANHVGSSNFNNLKMASWTQIQEMVDSGLASVGSHTYDMHYLVDDAPVFFDDSNQTAFAEDLVKSKAVIEAELEGVEVLDFAYPYGNGTTELAEVIQASGLRSAVILAPRIIAPGNAPYWLNRILVDDVVFDNIVLPWVKGDS